MGNRNISIGERYNSLAARRDADLGSLVPSSHLVNWRDKPFPFRIYRSPAVFGLPRPADAVLKSNDASTTERLSLLLAMIAAPLRRKLTANWNETCTSVATDPSALYGRAPASGGGLYPTEFYVCTAANACFRAGLYHYDGAHHRLVMLSGGHYESQVKEAVNGKIDHDIYLFIAIDFWKSCFKYHNFAYQVCGQDVGAALASLAHAAYHTKISLEPYFLFSDQTINEITGLDGNRDSTFVVMGLDFQNSRGSCNTPKRECEGNRPASAGRKLAVPRRVAYRERSKKVFIPCELLAIHQSSFIDRTDQLASADQEAGCCEKMNVSDNWLPNLSETTLRHSSWGSMRATPATDQVLILELLQGIHSSARRVRCHDVSLLSHNVFELIVYANNIDGLKRGLYSYHEGKRELQSCDLRLPDTHPLQDLYNLRNYNLDQAGCLLFIVGNTKYFFQKHGNRGLRMIHMQAGMAVQFGYLEAVRLGLCCGAVLGLKVHALSEYLGLSQDKTVLVGMFIGKGHGELRQLDISFQNELWV